jgi:hypothetical protein
MRTFHFAVGAFMVGLSVAGAETVKEMNLTRQAKSGIDSALATSGRWDRDCNALTSSVTITGKPSNGTAWVVEAKYPVPARTPASGDTGKCAGKIVTGNKIMYRSNPGFHGTDLVTYDSHGGATVIHTTITIMVP